MNDRTTEFQRHEENRKKLASVLKDPVLIEALEVLKEELDAYPGGVAESNPVVAAARYQQIAGVNHVLKGLTRLTKTPETRKAPREKSLPLKPEDLKP